MLDTIFCLALSLAHQSQDPKVPPTALAHVRDLVFLENQGRAPANFDFVAPVRDGKVRGSFAFDALGVSFAAATGGVHSMRFVGGSPAAQAWPEGECALRTSDLRGSDRSRWIQGAPAWSSLRYTEVWPGIDAIHRGEGTQLRYDFELAPGADPRAIRLAFDEACELRIEADGTLVIETELGTMHQRAPHLFQRIDGREVEVDGAFRLLGEREVGFAVGAYDEGRQLVIDPVVSYSLLIGSDDEHETAVDVAFDVSGDMYALIQTSGEGELWNHGTTYGPANGEDVFLLWIDGNTGEIWTRVTFGGSLDESPFALRVVSPGVVVVAGETDSSDLPTAAPGSLPFQLGYFGGWDVFVARISLAGGALEYSTYIGGSSYDSVRGLEVDATGCAWVCGSTSSADFPLQNPADSTYDGSDEGFVLRLSAGADALEFSSFTDADGHTSQVDIGLLPSGGARMLLASNDEVGLRSVSATGSFGDLQTFGGSDLDVPNHLLVLAEERVLISGWTASADFPLVNPIEDSTGYGRDFLAVFDTNVGALEFSTTWGTHGSTIKDLALVSPTEVAITGMASGDSIALVDPLASERFQFDAYVSVLDLSNLAAVGVEFTTLLPGHDDERPVALAVSGAGSIAVTGNTTNARAAPDQLASNIQNSVLGVEASSIFVTRIDAGYAAGWGTAGFGLSLDQTSIFADERSPTYEFFVYRADGNSLQAPVGYEVLVMDTLVDSGTLTFEVGSQMVRGECGIPLGTAQFTIRLVQLPAGCAINSWNQRLVEVTVIPHEGGGGKDYDEDTTDNGSCVSGTLYPGLDRSGGLDGLRRFRDQFLARSAAGRVFTRAYYRVSAVIAPWLVRHPATRAAIALLFFPAMIALIHPGWALLALASAWGWRRRSALLLGGAQLLSRAAVLGRARMLGEAERFHHRDGLVVEVCRLGAVRALLLHRPQVE